MKRKSFSICQIMRIKRVRIGTMSMISGEPQFDLEETRKEACGIPLFTEPERKTGICKSCHEDWSVDGNQFASDDERQKALNAAWGEP